MTMQELLAIIIGEKQAQAIADKFEGDFTKLYRAEKEELMELDGIGEKTAEKIRAIVDFSEKLYVKQKRDEMINLDTLEKAYEYISAKLSHKEEEYFMVLLLDKNLNIVDEDIISKNTANQTTCEPRDLFKKAIRKGCKNIMLAHNHPSGDLRASKNDILTTQRLLKVGLFLGITIVDHIIVGRGGYNSMRHDGCLDFDRVLRETKDITF